jgi:nucleotide-binding universal stress UspA family protein
MYRTLVVGYATDRRGADAIALTRLLASATSVKDVVIVEASHGHPFSGSHADAGTPSTERDLGPLGEGWPAHVRLSSRVVSGSSPATALASAADEVEADLLVLGSSHRGFAGRVLAGTTAGGILPDATWPVVIAPVGYADRSSSLRRVGVAFDGSKESEAALKWGVKLASEFGATLRLLGVVLPPELLVEPSAGIEPGTMDSGFAVQQANEVSEIIGERMGRELEAARASTGLADAETVLITGDVRRELRRAAEDVDMLVLGSHGEGRVTGVLVGSVSRGLAHSCPAPLAVVPMGVREGDSSTEKAAPPA